MASVPSAVKSAKDVSKSLVASMAADTDDATKQAVSVAVNAR